MFQRQFKCKSSLLSSFFFLNSVDFRKFREYALLVIGGLRLHYLTDGTNENPSFILFPNYVLASRVFHNSIQFWNYMIFSIFFSFYLTLIWRATSPYTRCVMYLLCYLWKMALRSNYLKPQYKNSKRVSQCDVISLSATTDFRIKSALCNVVQYCRLASTIHDAVWTFKMFYIKNKKVIQKLINNFKKLTTEIMYKNRNPKKSAINNNFI